MLTTGTKTSSHDVMFMLESFDVGAIFAMLNTLCHFKNKANKLLERVKYL